MNPINKDSAEVAQDALVTAVGVFPGYPEARRAVEALRRGGFRDEQIGIIGPESLAEAGARSSQPNATTLTHLEEGAGLGAAAGGLVGVGLGAVVAMGLMSPFGPVVAGGALVALLASAGVGAAVGTVFGGLTGLGVPEDHARWYAGELEAGRVVVTVHAADGAAAREIIRAQGGSRPDGSDIGTFGTGLQATPF